MWRGWIGKCFISYAVQHDNEIVRMVTEGEESRIPKMIVYSDDVIMLNLNESTLAKKVQKVVIVFKDFGLNVALNKWVGMKISQKMGVHGRD
jgi:hypothetical protein